MKLTQSIDIKENIITAKVSVAELGNTTIDALQEQEQLHNFVRTIEYSSIDFSSNIKVSNAKPLTTSDPVDGSTIEEISIKDLINKKIILDENFEAELIIDIDKIPTSEYESNTVINSKELLGQSYAVIFIEKIKTAVAEKLAEIRALSSDIEEPVDVVL